MNTVSPGRLQKFTNSLFLLGLLSVFSLALSYGAMEVAHAEETAERTGMETDAASTTNVLPYDPAVLRRQVSQRGPHTEIQGWQARIEKDETSSRAVSEQCRPPSCRLDDTTVLVKLAPEQAPGQLRSASSGPAWSVPSDILDKASLERVFSHIPQKRLERSMADFAAAQEGGVSRERQPDLTRWYRLPVPAGETPDTVIQKLSLDSRVEVVEPIYQRQSFQASQPIPADPKIDQQ